MSKFYTAGQLAKLAGVSSRTIRFYDEKGILQPTKYSESDYRLYEENDLVILQEILMLKYIGLSLEEIRNLLQEKGNKSLRETLEQQRRLLLQKRKQLDAILYAVDAAREHCSSGELNLQDFTNIMQLLTSNEKFNYRYSFYDKYGTRQKEWFTWRFEKLGLTPGSKVLDAGCGHGMLWRKNWTKIPEGCSIMALDRAKEPLESLKCACGKQDKYLAEANIQFHFLQEDAEKLDYEDLKFDCIVANHFWDYIEDKETLMEKFSNILENNGVMISTISAHISVGDVNALVAPFLKKRYLKEYEKTKMDEEKTLKKQLCGYFTYIKSFSFQQELRIDKPEDVFLYLCQLDKELEEELMKRKPQFLTYIGKKLKEETAISIGANNILFVCKKN